MRCCQAFSSIIMIFHFLLFETKGTLVEDIAERLQTFDSEYNRMWWLHQSADWNYTTNICPETALARQYSSTAFSEWMRQWKLWARTQRDGLMPEEFEKEINIIASGVVFMNSEDSRLVDTLKSVLTRIYSSAKITLPELKEEATGEDQVMALMQKVRKPDILKSIWKGWRVQVGEKAKNHILDLIEVSNEAARLNGYSDVGEVWRAELGLDDVVTTVLTLWNDVKSFYVQLHAYVNHKLRLLYGQEHFRDSALIPAHLLGSLWGENWASLIDILEPFPEHPPINLTSIFNKEGYTLDDVLHKAGQIYTSMGFDDMAPSFWKKSMFRKPEDGRIVDCHSVSYDFALHNDFRIRMCGGVNEDTFLQAVHEMGHIHYYMSYHHLAMLYRNGANSAFHEAVGETMVYAAQTPECMEALNIVQHFNNSKELRLNILMRQALSKFVLIPFSLTVEIWRYMIFSGQINEKNMNSKWWELRQKFQGIQPPDEESANLFDAGSKYHILLNIPYIRYFVSRFLEHQFLESLCNIAEQDIQTCCFASSRKAGDLLKSMLSLGSSVSWQDALELLTGTRELKSSPIMDYYKPLYDWLIQYNINNNISLAQ